MKVFTQTSMEGMDLLFHSRNPEFLLRFLRILPQLFKANWMGFEKGFGYSRYLGFRARGFPETLLSNGIRMTLLGKHISHGVGCR